MKVISGGLAVDDRGVVRFVNDFNPTELGIKRFYTIQNHKKGFVRAWHGHLKESKYVFVQKGSFLVAYAKMIFNPRYLEPFTPEEAKQWQSLNDNYQLDESETTVLSDLAPRILYIPACYANGFKSLTDDGIIQFFSTSSTEECKGDDYRLSLNRDDINTYNHIWKENHR